ncbi:MAG: carboxypeptidase M32 [Thermoplasmatales archaeon]
MDQLIDEILNEYEKIWSIQQAQGLMGWDLETYMPEKAVNRRGDASAQLSLMEQSIYISIRDKVEKAEEAKDLTDLEKGIIRVLKRRIHYFMSIPPDLVARLDKVAATGTVAWRKARNESDFSEFEPYLEQMVEINREIADKLGYNGNPYNALLDLYEEGLTTDDTDRIFSSLLPASKDILEKIIAEGYFSSSHPLEKKKYNVESMRKVNEEITNLILMPKGRFRMDVSAHPFTIGLSSNDVRITTRYEGINFKASLYSTIHESGHAIYELQIPEDISKTPVGGGVSSGIHESQSRFWENFIGRSKSFTEIISPILKRHLKFLENYNVDDLYRYFNRVSPTMIRVDADEVTYNFHIALRYEMEKQMISGKIEIKEAPEIWNDLMERYIGIRPRNHAEGILQDIHWSQGSFGYFPTYSLGNVVAGMFWKSEDFENKVEKKDFTVIKEKLYDKLHKYGSIYKPKDLLAKTFGDTYNPHYLIEYLRDKYITRSR